MAVHHVVCSIYRWQHLPRRESGTDYGAAYSMSMAGQGIFDQRDSVSINGHPSSLPISKSKRGSVTAGVTDSTKMRITLSDALSNPFG